MSGVLFHAVEIDAERPLDVEFVRGLGTAAAGTITLLPFRSSEIDTLRLSDAGYVDEAGWPYPPCWPMPLRSIAGSICRQPRPLCAKAGAPSPSPIPMGVSMR
ncbi:hypothetical protein [Asaia platycodi]|uniref:hypothetical protein n=1 Tax=Asaia platycodi TaxID=610243 RepID=UPI00068820AC|nr:hypothetical protein [Asaia platycodi]